MNAKQIKLAVLLAIVVLSFLMSACGTDVKVTNPADALLAPASDTQNAIESFLQETCKKGADGHCLTMGN